MDLGLFFMPVHRPERPLAESYEQDRRLIIAADRLGFAEAWMGEHFTARTEPVASPLMFFASLIHETERIRFGTGVANLGNRHPLVIAAEAAQFDQLSGGRLMLGVGPGGLRSDAELFTGLSMDERVAMARDAIGALRAAWSAEAPFDLSTAHWPAALSEQVWPSHGVGRLLSPVQPGGPPLAMAMTSPGGRTPRLVADEDMIPMSANFVPIENAAAQWVDYEAARVEAGRVADRSIWRVCRNVLVTDSQAEADELVAEPDGVFAFYFRYLRGVGQINTLRRGPGLDAGIGELNEFLGVEQAIADSVIAGTVEHVTERLVAIVDLLGPFGTLLAVGHDDVPGRPQLWHRSLELLAHEVQPVVAAHMAVDPRA